MYLRDFFDLKLLEEILKDWSVATGMAVIAVDGDGKYISSEIGFTEFCIKYTRGSKEGLKRCVKCDKEGNGTYYCHAGLMDFSIDITVEGNVIAKIIGGQVLPSEPYEEKFRDLATQFGINPDQYIHALRKVPIKTEESIKASAALLSQIINSLVNLEYAKIKNTNYIDSIDKEIETSSTLINNLNKQSASLTKIEMEQRILALNASIEATRAGSAGKGFSVVATEFAGLTENSQKINKEIQDTIVDLTKVIKNMKKIKDN